MKKLFLLIPVGIALAGCGGGTNPYQKANVICGNAPKVIIQHDGDTNYVNDDWIEVICLDGTRRAVANG